MVLWFRKREPLVLGVDFNAAAVNVVALRACQGELIVERVCSVPLAAQVIVDHDIQDTFALSAALEQALKEIGVKWGRVRLFLPMECVIEKTVLVDATLSEEELEAHMQLETENSIPYPLSEAYRDFCILGPHVKDVGKMEVLWVATRKEVVESRLQVLRQVGLNVHSVEAHKNGSYKMTNLNLLPWREHLYQKAKKEWLMGLSVVLVLSLFILVITCMILNTRIHRSVASSHTLTSQLENLSSQLQRIQAIESSKTEVASKAAMFQTLQKERLNTMRVFSEVVNRMPIGVYLNALRQQDHQWRLEGVSESFLQVYIFVQQLAQIAEIKTPELLQIETTKPQKDDVQPHFVVVF